MTDWLLGWVSGFLMGLGFWAYVYARKLREDNVQLDDFLKRLRFLDQQYGEMQQSLYKADRENEALRDYVQKLIDGYKNAEH